MSAEGASESGLCLDEETGLVVETDALQMKELNKLKETGAADDVEPGVSNGTASEEGSEFSELNGPETEEISKPVQVNGETEGVNGHSENGEDEDKDEESDDCSIIETDGDDVVEGDDDDDVVSGKEEEEEEDMDTDVVFVGDSGDKEASRESVAESEGQSEIKILDVQSGDLTEDGDVDDDEKPEEDAEQSKESVINLEDEDSKLTSKDGSDDEEEKAEEDAEQSKESVINLEDEDSKLTSKDGSDDEADGDKVDKVDMTKDKEDDDDVVVVREEPKTTGSKPVPVSEPAGTKSPSTTKPPSQSENMRPVGKLLYDLGLDLARQQVYKDLIKIQNKKSAHSKLGDKEERQLSKLKLAYDNILSKNEPYQTDLITCQKCDFMTESLNALELHKEHAHARKDNPNVFECSFCDIVSPSSHVFYAHMDNVHGRRGRIQPAKSTYDCHYCNFETNAKRAFVNHNARCAAKFDLKKNLAPAPSDYDIPLEIKKPVPGMPPLAPAIGQPPLATNTQVRPGFNPPPLTPNTRGMTPLPVSGTGQQLFQLGNTLYTLVHSQGQAFLTPVLPGSAQAANPPGIVRPMAPRVGGPPPQLSAAPRLKSPQSNTINTVRSILEKHKVNMPSVPPLKPIHKPAVPVLQPKASAGSKGFEVCEICGGTARDREALRIHIFYAHKVEITPEIFNQKSGPLLSCELCQQKFWTYQGVMRHTQTQHGLKANNNVGGSSICCICGEHNLPMGMLAHLVARHNVSIRRFLEMNKCFLCKTSFPVHFLLKMHMLKDHKAIIPSNNVFASFLKSLGLSKAFMPVAGADVPLSNHLNSSQLPNTTTISGKKGKNMDVHMLADTTPEDKNPHKCSRCSRRFPYQELLHKHYADVHHNDKDPCPLCDRHITIGRPMVRHMKMEHLTECSVVVQKLPRKQYFFYMAKKRKRMEAEARSRNDSKTSVEDTSEVDSSLAETPVKRARIESGETEVRLENGSDKENSEETAEVTEEKVEMNGDEEPMETKHGKMTEVIDLDGEQIIIEEQVEDD